MLTDYLISFYAWPLLFEGLELLEPEEPEDDVS